MDQAVYRNSWLQDFPSKRLFLTNASDVVNLGPHSFNHVWNEENVETRRILQYLFQFQHAACRDWRDRIYALVSLVGRSKVPMMPDCRLSSRKVLNAFVCACVAEGTLDPLLLAAAWQYGSTADRELSEEPAGLPSWVPDIDRLLPPRSYTHGGPAS